MIKSIFLWEIKNGKAEWQWNMEYFSYLYQSHGLPIEIAFDEIKKMSWKDRIEIWGKSYYEQIGKFDKSKKLDKDEFYKKYNKDIDKMTNHSSDKLQKEFLTPPNIEIL